MFAAKIAFWISIPKRLFLYQEQITIIDDPSCVPPEETDGE